MPDYGGRDETLEVVAIDPPRALIYRSERRAAVFSWALLLTPLDGGRTGVHLRFRGAPRSTGLKLRLLAGLDERVRS